MGGNDTLNGGIGDDYLAGGSGNDNLFGEAKDNPDIFVPRGNDTLDGGIGNDGLSGGDGNDVMYGGVGNDGLGGNDGSDILYGGDGNDTLNAGTTYVEYNYYLGDSTSDFLYGGDGYDTYIVGDQFDDEIIEAANAGIDTVIAYTNYQLTANVENLILRGNRATTAIGNNLNNTITGNSNSNTLIGGGGNDIINVGNDIPTSLGEDILYGGDGNDTLYSSSYSRLFNGNYYSQDEDTLYGGSGDDVLYPAIGCVAYGGSGNDTLSGALQSGNVGGVGDDTYFVGREIVTAYDPFNGVPYDVVITVGITEEANAGIDTVYASYDYTLFNNFENLVLTHDATIGNGNSVNNTLTGNSLNNVLDGKAGNDTLIGLAGNDTLIGGEGNDILTSKQGNDRLIGGKGIDELYGGAGNDTLSFKRLDGGGSTDTLAVDGSGVFVDLTTLPNNRIQGIEIIDLTGTGNNSLKLTRLDLLDLSNTTNQLIVNGNAGDAVTSTRQRWLSGGTTTLNGILYDCYTSGAATLLVDADITQTIS
ncbi:hypothetical protein NIES1031_14765 [Chroogloeocystis siderophila 5.2 s.c.1]|uniref:Calcium-binding protein n=1 Tax=Chroogloeocystis siderophila 5.2 s.c.1 TaxID=247279 RepID=A0A1U7HNF4_9CHRO|nr:calcium-binding protein [Chroogloeocystis siderophila]OKH25099.1 hypothetical protein NIES1031_14765 [Chroogloeocystis siderophila 5.2 s.c.1]